MRRDELQVKINDMYAFVSKTGLVLSAKKTLIKKKESLVLNSDINRQSTKNKRSLTKIGKGVVDAIKFTTYFTMTINFASNASMQVVLA